MTTMLNKTSTLYYRKSRSSRRKRERRIEEEEQSAYQFKIEHGEVIDLENDDGVSSPTVNFRVRKPWTKILRCAVGTRNPASLQSSQSTRRCSIMAVTSSTNITSQDFDKHIC